MEIVSALVALVVLVTITIVPVMLAARLIGAGRIGFGSALAAVLLQYAFSVATRLFAPNLGVPVLVAIVAGSAIYAFVLDTTLIRGFLIGIVSTIIGVVVLLILGSLFMKGANAI